MDPAGHATFERMLLEDHQVEAVWQREDYLEWWSIGNYDGMETYCEWKLLLPKCMRQGEEFDGKSYQKIRSKLIQVENEISNVRDVEGLERQKIKDKTWKDITEIFMNCYQACEGQEQHSEDGHRPKRVWMHKDQQHHTNDGHNKKTWGVSIACGGATSKWEIRSKEKVTTEMANI